MNDIRETVNLIRDFIETDYVKELKKTKSDFEYKEFFDEVFPTFQKNYPTLLYYILDGNEPIFLDKMIESLDAIYNGEDKFEVEKRMGEDLANHYLPAKFRPQFKK